MQTFLSIITILVFLNLLIVVAMRPIHSQLSLFELRLRASGGDDSAKKALEREKLLDDVVSLQRVVVSLLLIVFVVLSVKTFGWLIGVLLSLLVALEYGAIAQIKFLRRISQRLYARIDSYLIKFIKKAPFLFRLLRNVSTEGHDVETRIHSREELQCIINQSKNVLSVEERLLIVNGLSFNEQLVNSVMVPRSSINYIEKSEFLGPLVLDKLYKKGHLKLPVISGSLDNVIGVLDIKALLALDTKRSITAEKAMDKRVYYVRADQTLRQAMAAFLKTKQYLLVVVNEAKETVGLLVLGDVLEVLFGSKVDDSFDSYEDLSAVALRDLRKDSKPKQAI